VIVDGFSHSRRRSRGNGFIGTWRKGRHLSLVQLEVRLAHTVKVSLGLLLAAADIAFARLGAVTLTETLRFHSASATDSSAVTTLVFEKFAIDSACRSSFSCSRS
jgi:hypothetical protein